MLLEYSADLILKPLGLHLQISGHSIDARDGPFFSSVFFATGYLLSARTPRRLWVYWGGALFLGGLLAHVTENGLIHAAFHAPNLLTADSDFVFGTYAMGIGATMIALAEPGWLTSVTLARWGRLTLGIYCVHLFFVEWLDGVIGRFDSPAAEVLYPVAVLLLSFFAAHLVSRVKLTRTLVQ